MPTWSHQNSFSDHICIFDTLRPFPMFRLLVLLSLILFSASSEAQTKLWITTQASPTFNSSTFKGFDVEQIKAYEDQYEINNSFRIGVNGFVQPWPLLAFGSGLSYYQVKEQNKNFNTIGLQWGPNFSSEFRYNYFSVPFTIQVFAYDKELKVSTVSGFHFDALIDAKGSEKPNASTEPATLLRKFGDQYRSLVLGYHVGLMVEYPIRPKLSVFIFPNYRQQLSPVYSFVGRDVQQYNSYTGIDFGIKVPVLTNIPDFLR